MKKKISIISICGILLTACANTTSEGIKEQQCNRASEQISEETSNQESDKIYENPMATLAFSLLPDDFTLINAEGEETFFDSYDYSFTGDLEVMESFHTIEDYRLYVEDSDKFVYQTEETNCEFTVIGHKIYANIEGINIQEIVVEADGTVQLTGDNMEYKVKIDVYKDRSKNVDTSGTGSGTVTINQ